MSNFYDGKYLFLVQKLEITQRFLKVKPFRGKYDILILQEKQQAYRGNKHNKFLEMSTWQR